MRSFNLKVATIVAGAVLLAPALILGETVTTTQAALLDKIRGAWVAKAYGVAVGGPTEFRYMGEMIEGPLAVTPAELPSVNSRWGLQAVPNQDDLYVNMVFLKVVADSGFDAPASAFAKAFAYAGFGLGHANAQARQNVLAGIPPDQSGLPRYSPHAEDIDFQIEADFIGLISPGLPQAAWKLSQRVGHIMNYGDGFYGGVFVAALYEAAFVRDDIEGIVNSALEAIPSDSGYAKLIRDVLRWHKQYPNDWKANWRELQRRWGQLDRCPWGVTGTQGAPKGMFNISARLNGAYVVLGLLYGKGDLERTVEIATRAGQDSDCNPATAGGVLGAKLGYNKLPEDVRTVIAPHMNVKFSNTVYTIESASEECLRLAMANVNANGGRESNGRIQIQARPFRPAGPTEVAFAGLEPTDGFLVTDKRIVWKGDWKGPDARRAEDGTRYSSTAGDVMEAEFSGTAVYVEGAIRHDAGILEVLLDGKPMGKRDMSLATKAVPNTGQVSAVWLTGLPDGKHNLRVRVTGEKSEASEGAAVHLGRIASYRGRIEK